VGRRRLIKRKKIAMPGKMVRREETFGIGGGEVGRDYGFLIRYDGGMSYGV